jgi:hypothetical protein
VRKKGGCHCGKEREGSQWKVLEVWTDATSLAWFPFSLSVSPLNPIELINGLMALTADLIRFLETEGARKEKKREMGRADAQHDVKTIGRARACEDKRAIAWACPGD